MDIWAMIPGSLELFKLLAEGQDLLLKLLRPATPVRIIREEEVSHSADVIAHDCLCQS